VEANSDSIARMAKLFSFSCDNLDLKYVLISLSLEKLLSPPATVTGMVSSIFKTITVFGTMFLTPTSSPIAFVLEGLSFGNCSL
jgi:hypothetical protein